MWIKLVVVTSPALEEIKRNHWVVPQREAPGLSPAMVKKVQGPHYFGSPAMTKMLRPNLTSAEDNPLVTGQLFKRHGASGMKFLGTYAYLSA